MAYGGPRRRLQRALNTPPKHQTAAIPKPKTRPAGKGRVHKSKTGQYSHLPTGRDQSMPEERRPPLIIASPDDAWSVLQDISQNRFDPDFFYGVEFTGWSLELMRLPEAATSSISIPLMRSLVEYQSHVK
jgi:hypothetical protein